MSALILIDLQEGFRHPSWGKRNNPDLEQNVRMLLSRWRDLGLPIIHVQHLSLEEQSPLRPGQPGVQFIPASQPIDGELIIQKHVHSAFIGTDLEAILRKQSINSLTVCGFTSDHCVSTTARMGCDLGFKITLVSDAVATFARKGLGDRVYSADEVQAISLASLNVEFATIKSTAEIVQLERQ